MNAETNNVRRFPRTMEEAFGPYTSPQLDPMPPTDEERAQQANRELIAATLLAALAGIAGLILAALAGIAGLILAFAS